ncbi:MAG TPA: starch synthase [Bacteroidetes bacterium]|nr:starch synthase [Bacteroidota bacterium]
MNKVRILYITQEIKPYTDFTEMADYMRELVLNSNTKSNELRILMPKFGTINERRHKLHEVVRLSGMNIIIDDDDFPLIIKVASLPESRIQVYFLDNDEFFKKRLPFADENNVPFEDNDSRAIFFCKGGIETVKKFGWPPYIIHVGGWMSSLVPLFIRKVYQDDPVYNHSKIVYTPFINDLKLDFKGNFKQKVLINDMTPEDLTDYVDKDGNVDLNFGAIKNSDAVMLPFEEGMEQYIEFAENNNIPFYIHKQEDKKYKGETEFYHSLLED